MQINPLPKQETEAKESNYFGETAKRYKNVEITYIKSTGFDSAFGYCYLHSFAGPNGSRLLWKSSSNVYCAAGEALTATFTVKKHEDYKGCKQTKINRLVYESHTQAVPAIAA